MMAREKQLITSADTVFKETVGRRLQEPEEGESDLKGTSSELHQLFLIGCGEIEITSGRSETLLSCKSAVRLFSTRGSP